MNDKCPICGADYSLVGRVHNCRSNPVNSPVSQVNKDGVNPSVNPQEVNKQVNEIRERLEAPVNPHKPGRGAYPNSDKRREYMKEYMRRRRARGK